MSEAQKSHSQTSAQAAVQEEKDAAAEQAAPQPAEKKFHRFGMQGAEDEDEAKKQEKVDSSSPDQLQKDAPGNEGKEAPKTAPPQGPERKPTAPRKSGTQATSQDATKAVDQAPDQTKDSEKAKAADKLTEQNAPNDQSTSPAKDANRTASETEKANKKKDEEKKKSKEKKKDPSLAKVGLGVDASQGNTAQLAKGTGSENKPEYQKLIEKFMKSRQAGEQAGMENHPNQAPLGPGNSTRQGMQRAPSGGPLG